MRVGWLLCVIGSGCAPGGRSEDTRTASEIQNGAEDRVRKARTVQVRFSGSDADGTTSVSGMLTIDGENKAFLLLEGSFAGQPFTLSHTCDGKTARMACSLFARPSTVPAPPKSRDYFLDLWLDSGVMGFLPKVTVDIPGEAPKNNADSRIDLARDRGPNDIVEGRECVSVRYLIDGKPVLTRWYDITSGLPVRREMRMPGKTKPVWTESYRRIQLDEAIDPATFAVPKD